MAIDDDDDQVLISGATDEEIVELPEDKADGKTATKPPQGTAVQDEEGGDDDRLNVDARAGESDGEGDDEHRSSRSEERRRRKERQRQAKIKADREIAELRGAVGYLLQEVTGLRGTQVSSEISTIENKIAEVEDQVRRAEAAHAAAITKNDGNSAVEALRIRDSGNEALRQMKAAKAHIERNARGRGDDTGEERETRRPATDAPRADPRVVRRAKAWAESNPWYGAKGAEDDTAIARQIDAEVAADGFEQHSDEYFKELDARLKAEIPHRYRPVRRAGATDRSNNSDEPRRRASPPVAGSSRALGKNEVRLTPERKQALEEGGYAPGSKQYINILKSWKQQDERAAR